jgi:DNA-binding NtrC family response regulator
MSHRILLVDDDPEHLKINKRLLTAKGYTVSIANTGEEAVEIVKKARADFALILMDHQMPNGIGGPAATSEIAKIAPNQQIVTFSMHGKTRDVTRENFLAGADDVLDKNMSNDDFLKEVANYCAKYDQFHKTIRIGNITPDEKINFITETHMHGASDQTYNLCRYIRKIAPTEATILVLGESGTGKEVVADAIHKCSRRAKGPFVAVNIGAENKGLLDSSLFGHRKGSFTDATADQPGKFKLADGGTIFLDEIGDLSLDMQVKLLRVIQEREICPLGATKPIPVDVRIITATHQDLEKMVKEGTFREDLYYRINTMVVKTTPLRERPDDIEILVGLFTDEVCEREKFRRRFSQQCLEPLRKHYWRNNVRELRSVVERHLIKSESATVNGADLERYLLEEYVPDLPTTMDAIDKDAEKVKKDHLARVISASDSYAHAARKLGVAPNRLHYFLNKFGLGDLLS